MSTSTRPLDLSKAEGRARTSAVGRLPIGRSGADALAVATRASCSAAVTVLARFGNDHYVKVKGRGDLATDADVEAERVVLASINQEFPEHGVVAEESGVTGDVGAYRWFVDPLDGSMNYSRGIPFFCVSVALMDPLIPLLGVIADPLRREVFCAVRGAGAFVNGLRTAVRRPASLGTAVMGTDLGYDDASAVETLRLMRGLWGNYQSLRVMGSCALGLAYVAAGRLDLYYHPSAYPWDYAAGWLLVTEAGGIATSLSGAPLGGERTSVLAGPQAIQPALLAIAARKP